MPKIAYVSKKFSADSLGIIAQANSIIDEYEQQGFKLTLRQLYYQFVSRDFIKNNQQEYKRLGGIINDARLAGQIDWHAIEDRTRNLQSLSHWNNPAEIVEACSQQYHIDRWASQPNRVEVFIEKDALLGVIEGICRELDVPYFSCRGYTSQSEMWAAAMRLERYRDNGQTPIIIHLGDHDPSGIDMTRDIRDRIELFMGGVEVNRIALNENQIKQYNPPPNFAKATDSRFTQYQEIHGDESWELDALDPNVIVSLVEDTVREYLDEEKWEEAIKWENTHRALIKKSAESLEKEYWDSLDKATKLTTKKVSKKKKS
jgi:hypothetical protein